MVRLATPRQLPLAKVVAFDLDNTLIDILHVKTRAAEAAAWALADAGMDIHPHKAAQAMLKTALQIGLDRDDIVDHYVQAKLSRSDPRLCAVGRHAYERAEDESARAYPRSHSTLLELTRRGYVLILITDAPRERALRRLQAARLTPFFQMAVTLEATGRGKETTAPFEVAANMLQVLPEQMVMVGDNPRLDVGSAKAFGCATVLARYGLQPQFVTDDPQLAPTASIDWIDQLLTLLPGHDSENPLRPPPHAVLAQTPGEATV